MQFNSSRVWIRLSISIVLIWNFMNILFKIVQWRSQIKKIKKKIFLKCMYLFISLKRSNDVWKNEMSNVHGLLVINIQTYFKKIFILLKNIITKILSKNPLRLGKSSEFDLKLTLDYLKVLVSIYTNSCQYVLSIELINSDI